LSFPCGDAVWPTQPGRERLDGGEDLLIVAHPRIMVNSGQSDELAVRAWRTVCGMQKRTFTPERGDA
jgi:hypothetical protein